MRGKGYTCTCMCTYNVHVHVHVHGTNNLTLTCIYNAQKMHESHKTPFPHAVLIVESGSETIQAPEAL